MMSGQRGRRYADKSDVFSLKTPSDFTCSRDRKCESKSASTRKVTISLSHSGILEQEQDRFLPVDNCLVQRV